MGGREGGESDEGERRGRAMRENCVGDPKGNLGHIANGQNIIL